MTQYSQDFEPDCIFDVGDGMTITTVEWILAALRQHKKVAIYAKENAEIPSLAVMVVREIAYEMSRRK